MARLAPAKARGSALALTGRGGRVGSLPWGSELRRQLPGETAQLYRGAEAAALAGGGEGVLKEGDGRG